MEFDRELNGTERIKLFDRIHSEKKVLFFKHDRTTEVMSVRDAEGAKLRILQSGAGLSTFEFDSSGELTASSDNGISPSGLHHDGVLGGIDGARPVSKSEVRGLQRLAAEGQLE